MGHRGSVIPWDVRERIARLLRGGASQRQVARQLGVARNTVGKYGQDNMLEQAGEKSGNKFEPLR